MAKNTQRLGAYSKGGFIKPDVITLEGTPNEHGRGSDMDLRRWRAMDQMINNPYHIEGQRFGVKCKIGIKMMMVHLS